MSYIIFRTFLLILLLSTLSSAQDCCFTDACSKNEFCVERNETFTDDCDVTYQVTPECKLERKRCCFKDACSEESLCGFVNEEVKDACKKTYLINRKCGLDRRCCYTDRCSEDTICALANGVLQDSCGLAFDVLPNCTLSQNDAKKVMKDDENGIVDSADQSVEPESTTEPSSDSESNPGTTQPTVTPEPPTQPPSTQPPSTSTISTISEETDDDIATTISSEAVCIHAEHLSHLPSSAMLYPRHILANILCDTSGSCATPGHMVVYKGMSMRMSRYCQVVGCQRLRGLVNSPRYSRGGRVESKTEDLQFTMLAARFETRFEEILLGALVRAGL